MKLKKKIWMAIFFVGVLLLLGTCSYAGTQKLNSLDYDAQLKSDGSMDVVETWEIDIQNTNTLFKDFELDERKYSGITNVKVKDLETGRDLTEISEEMYHVTKNCYYGLPISDWKFEIAWGVGLDNSSATKKYQISYTVEDAVTVHEDCSELYWQFVGTDNAVPAKKVTGKILLPEAVKETENLRVWAHGPLNGEIHKTSNREVTFLVKDFKPETMLEVRIVTEENLFEQSLKYSYQDALEEIMFEEKMWAESANEERNKAKILASVIGIIFIFYIFKIVKYSRILNQIFKEQQQFDIGKYFRDIPREKSATPAEAAFLLKLYNESSVFSATLLQLCLKGYISFEAENAKNIKINLHQKESSDLKPSEKSILELLQEIAGAASESLTMEDIKKFARKEYEKFGDVMKEIQEGAKDFYHKIGYYDIEKEKIANKYGNKGVLYIVGVILFMCTGAFMITPLIGAIVIEWLICFILLITAFNKKDCLTEPGQIEKQQWKGLKNYMVDFSMLKDREVPDLVLWEQYLVYATAFGISEKVVKQLKVVYPQLQNLDSNTYMYLYLMSDTRFSNGFINEFNQSTSGIYSAYVASLPSSDSGSGGGFSSGGGGRWRRRPEWAEDRRNNESWN